MAKTSMKIKQQRAPKFSTRASVSQHTRDRSQALKKLAGKPESNLVNTSAYALCELSAKRTSFQQQLFL